jgi:hypothetical protein
MRHFYLAGSATSELGVDNLLIFFAWSTKLGVVCSVPRKQ